MGTLKARNEATSLIGKRADRRPRPAPSSQYRGPQPAYIRMDGYSFGRFRDRYPVSGGLGGCYLVVIYNNIGWVAVHIRPGGQQIGFDRYTPPHEQVRMSLDALIHDYFAVPGFQDQAFSPPPGDNTPVIPGFSAIAYLEESDWGNIVEQATNMFAASGIDRFRVQRYDAHSFVNQGFGAGFLLRWDWKYDRDHGLAQETIIGIAYTEATTTPIEVSALASSPMEFFVLGPEAPELPPEALKKERFQIQTSRGQKVLKIKVRRVPWAVALAYGGCSLEWKPLPDDMWR